MNKNDFIFHKKLGRGAFGKVFLVSTKQKTNSFALKVVAKKDIRSDVEYRIAKTIKHPLIVDTHACFSSAHHIFFVMEYVPNKSIQDLLDSRSEPLRKGYLA